MNELIPHLQVPESVRRILAPFQMDGVEFVLSKGGRAMIADEMGLGKTIQVNEFSRATGNKLQVRRNGALRKSEDFAAELYVSASRI